MILLTRPSSFGSLRGLQLWLMLEEAAGPLRWRPITGVQTPQHVSTLRTEPGEEEGERD